MPRGFQPIPGVRLKVRTSPDGEFLTVTPWLDNEAMGELARIRKSVVEHVPGQLWQEWLSSTEAIFSKQLSAVTGVDGLRTFRRKADYTGEIR